MAEGLAVAGSVVGIVSIAIQLVDTVQQLKSFVGDVRHAPQDVAEMLDHVDTLGEMIQNIAAEEQEHPNAFARNKSLQTCLTRCDGKIRAISTLLKQLAESVRKSRLKGSLRTVFRTRDVQKLTDKLEKAQELLAFAYQIYTNSLIREINREGTQMIITEVQKMHLVVQSQASSSSSDCSFALAGMNQQSLASDPRVSTLSLVSAKSASPQCETVPSCTAEREENRKSICQSARTTYRFRVPIWFTSRYWEIQLRHAQSGWDNKIRTYNVVPYSSPIFQYCSDWDIEAVRYLFQQGRASPFDRSPTGMTLLHYATCELPGDNGAQTELCRLLLEAGIDASTLNNYGETCASEFCLHSCQNSSWVATWDILTAHAGIDTDSSPDIYLHPLVRCSSSEAIMAVRRHMYPSLEDRSYGDRVRFAIEGYLSRRIDLDTDWDMFRARLGCDPADPTFLMFIIPDHDLMASYLATVVEIFSKTKDMARNGIASQLWRIVALAAENGANLQAEQYMSHGGDDADACFPEAPPSYGPAGLPNRSRLL